MLQSSTLEAIYSFTQTEIPSMKAERREVFSKGLVLLTGALEGDTYIYVSPF